MQKTEKKVKKKPSLTAQIRKLREDSKRLDKIRHNLWVKNWELERELDELKKYFPTKYYKIKFKIKANAGHTVEAEEVIEAFTIHSAINKAKKNKTHPDTFELVDIRVMGE